MPKRSSLMFLVLVMLVCTGFAQAKDKDKDKQLPEGCADGQVAKVDAAGSGCALTTTTRSRTPLDSKATFRTWMIESRSWKERIRIPIRRVLTIRTATSTAVTGR